MRRCSRGHAAAIVKKRDIYALTDAALVRRLDKETT
jgi:hypothetical protein